MKHIGPILFLIIVLGVALVWLEVYPLLLEHYKSYPQVIYDLALILGGQV